MNRVFVFLLVAGLLFLIDLYVWQAVRTVSRGLSETAQRTIGYVYWGFTGLALLAYIALQVLPPDSLGRITRTFIMTGIVMPYLAKLFAVLFIAADDAGRFVRWAIARSAQPQPETATISVSPSLPSPLASPSSSPPISRSDFLMKTALIAGAVPLVGFTYGIISGAHDYRVRRIKLPIKNLPSGFNGLKIAQLSDIHSGSFFNKTAVKGGIDMLLNEKPDLVFFTGDLVNSKAEEVRDYISIFEKVTAPLGVFSTLGNHDYGDYAEWPTPEAKRRNLNDLKAAHKQMGWQLMMDESHILETNGDKIALIGVQNWGAGARWPKYGDLAKALRGAEDYPVKLLLSHDPSHWDAQVRPNFPEIDVMFAGHTHGMQFGIETELFRWSPSQYAYKQWAGLYQEGNQRLYVNRGYGYIGYPGRVGILPEVTIFELVQAT